MELEPSARTAAAALTLLVACTLWSSQTAEARLTNVVTDWINATQYVVATTGAHNVPASKWYALTSLAVYNSVTAGKGKAPAAALAAYAGHAINSGLFPWNQPSRYDTLLAAQLGNVSDADRKAAAAVALPIADNLLQTTAGGEFSRWTDFQPAPPGTPNAYQFVPNQTFAIYPQAKYATPWLLTYEEADNIAYNKDPKNGPVFQPSIDGYQATADLGVKNSTSRTQEQTDIAWYWALPSSSITGFGFDIARELLPTDYSIEDTALFFARAALANWDSQLVGWRIKYTTLHWRPTTAFRQGFPGFTAIPDWTPLIRVPSHPEYPSGHTVTLGALQEVLLRTFNGKDDIPFSIASDSWPQAGKRNFTSFNQAAEEGAISRLYGGVHFPAANNDGLKVGRAVASWTWGRIRPGSPVSIQKPRTATTTGPTGGEHKSAVKWSLPRNWLAASASGKK